NLYTACSSPLSESVSSCLVKLQPVSAVEIFISSKDPPSATIFFMSLSHLFMPSILRVDLSPSFRISYSIFCTGFMFATSVSSIFVFLILSAYAVEDASRELSSFNAWERECSVLTRIMCMIARMWSISICSRDIAETITLPSLSTRRPSAL
ncbi:hypothetical protein T484DRAFT_3639410, partial [Baffinella frigidus]